MSVLEDYKRSLSSMTYEEALELHTNLRKRRIEAATKAKAKAKAKTRSKKEITRQEILDAIKAIQELEDL